MQTVSELEQPSIGRAIGTFIGRILLAILIPTVAFLFLWQGFIFLRDSDAPKWMIAIVAVLWGVGGVAMLYFVANWLVEKLPKDWYRRLIPFVFVGPAIAILFWALGLPAIRTLIASLYGPDGTKFVGLQNYVTVFSNPDMLVTFRNNLLWVVFGTIANWFAGRSEPSSPASRWPPPNAFQNSTMCSGRTQSASAKTSSVRA